MTFPYRLLLWIAPRLMLGLALWRLLGRETKADLAERLGLHPATLPGPALEEPVLEPMDAKGPKLQSRKLDHPKPNDPQQHDPGSCNPKPHNLKLQPPIPHGLGGAVWVHGASNGELASALWVIAALAEHGPVHVTASTVSGRALVRSWGLKGVTASLAPLDLRFALRRFLAVPPRAFVNLEGEFWPERFRALRGVPVALIGARMSARSARFWAKAGAAFLGGVRLASAQDAGSEARLRALGLPDQAWTAICDLKAEAVARQPQATPRPRAERAHVLLAASTHEGEEEAILQAFAASQFRLLILAPRHPRRGDDLARRMEAQGLAFARRSKGAPVPDTGIYLADTLGEMDLWYAMAGACFVGGSLVDKGGHTPWEPLHHGAAILHGPHVANFAAIYAALDACGGARQGLDLTGLDGAAQERMALAAYGLRKDTGGAALLTALLAMIEGK